MDCPKKAEIAADGIQYPLQRGKVGRLDEVVVETELAGSLLILAWPYPLRRSARTPSSPGRLERSAHLEAVHTGQPDVEQDHVRPDRVCHGDGRGPSCAMVDWCPAPCIRADMLSAASGDRRRPGSESGPGDSTQRHFSSALAGTRGSRTTNSLPLPVPALDACTVPPCMCTRFARS